MEENKAIHFIEDIPSVLPVIPTMDVVVFPHMVVPLLVLDEQIINGIEQTLEESKKVLLLATKSQLDGIGGPVGINDLHSIGTVATIMRIMKVPEGGVKVLVQGLIRARVEEIISSQSLLKVRLTPVVFKDINNYAQDNSALEARLRNIYNLVDAMSSSGRIFGPDSQIILSQMKDSEKIADFILSHLNINVSKAQGLLEKESLIEFLDGIYDILNGEIEIVKVQEKIQSDARDSINKSQREYYLREQLRAIRRELGEENDQEIEELRKKAATLDLNEEARIEVNRQIKRLEKIPADSMETTVIRNYVDWIFSLPWGLFTKDILDISYAKEILDKDHFGLEEIKDRVLDYLSVRAIKDNCNTPILCFVGPPGVGKTSLGQSIARSMGRNFYRISLGGVHDEAEIRGHRRTYVGALPGRFIQAIRKAGSMNPVIMIDEIDKITSDQRGDPSAALLEVLDPAQNQTFYDNYLGIPFDLSKVLFITTANDLSRISTPLRDRMEIIQLSGYTYQEKLEISKRYLVPKAISNFGLDNFGLCDITLNEIINGYTREAGVRQLEKVIQKLSAKYARILLEEKRQITFSKDNLHQYLGTKRISSLGTTLHRHKVGVSTGLAWTPYGGEILQVEAILMPGSGKLILTGQLGDVMKESAQAAISYAKSHATVFGIPKEHFTNFDIHVHIPAGAIPKDGPSAGITLLSSILSVLTSRPVNGDYAMTGELNLQGAVLPIGGVKEKILAAKQEGLSHIIVPKLNEMDLDCLGDLRKDLNIILVEDVAEVLDKVLMPKAKC